MPTHFSSFEAFRSTIEILAPDDAARARQSFIATRIDPASETQRADALRLKMGSDGWVYTGYLWDFFIDKHVITDATLWRSVELMSSDIYFMWDLHSADRVRSADYFRLPLGTVARAIPKHLRGGLKYLPEDLYVFDRTMAWAGGLTHEYTDDGRRYCVWSGDLPNTTTRQY